jgi:C4-dicarboxylate-specific signal transduction histidine kinase
VPAGERRLTLKLEAHAGQASLSVIDSGPGIPALDRPRVFEPFFTNRAEGLGLGLSLCETLAASMDGQLELLELPGRGAAFRLTLPQAPADASGP